MTTSASKRWRAVRDDFDLWVELLGFQREVPFKGLSGKRRWRFDYAREDVKVAIEYNGLMGAQNASHLSIGGVVRDDEKTTNAQLCGWLLIRVNARSVESGDAHTWIEKALNMREGQR